MPIAQTATELGDQIKAVRDAAAVGAKAVYIHGGQVDYWFAQKEYHMLKEALKVMREGATADEEKLERFRREARVASEIGHSGIIPVLDFGEHKGRLYMAMELIEGETLAAGLARGASPSGGLRPIATRPKLAYSRRAAHFSTEGWFIRKAENRA